MAVNPETKLNDLKAKLKEKETEVDSLLKSKESLKGEVAGLEKVVREINQVSASYSQALLDFETTVREIEDYSKERMPEIEAAAGDKKEAAGAKIGEIDSRIKKTGKERSILEEKTLKARTDYETAKQEFLKKQGEFDSLKTLRKSIGDKLNDIKALKASVEKEGKKGEGTPTANLVFLITELERQLAVVKSEIKSPEEFKILLIKAWQEMDSTGTAVKEKEEQMKEAIEKFEGKKKEFELMLQDRRKTILTELTNI
jgi:chromosome segregation ATPase